MPELPEAQTITSDLKKHLSGFSINKVVIAKNYKVYPDPETFKEKVEGRKIMGARRIAKNILLELDNDTFVGFHLAMTGRILLKDNPKNIDKWTKVVFSLSKEEKTVGLIFTDVRMFGKVSLLQEKDLKKLKEKYGPEPIDEQTTAEVFYIAITSKKTNIKNALLDQSIVSGLGNIYATDALFLSGIHPETPTQKISKDIAINLLKAAKDILNEGISNRGSTLPDKMYVDIFGKEGSQQKHFKIYMKDYCPKCNTKVSFIFINGRGTYFCPNCQPITPQKSLF